MLNLSQDQRGLLDFLADRVRELVASANQTAGVDAATLLAEAEELTAIRGAIVDRYSADCATQLHLPLDVKQAA